MNIDLLKKTVSKNGYIQLEKLPKDSFVFLPTKKRSVGILKFKDAKFYWKPNIYNNYDHFAEMIYQSIAKKIDLPAAKTTFAEWGDTVGTISEDFKQNKYEEIAVSQLIETTFNAETLHYYNDFSLEQIEYVFDKMVEKNEITTKQQVEFLNHFVKTLILDIILMNEDRNDRNFSLLHKNNEYLVAPVFDNVACLCLNLSNNYLIKSNLKNNYSAFTDKNTPNKFNEHFLNGYNESLRFTYTSKESKSVNNLTLIAHNYPEVFDKTLNTLCTLDINEVLKEVSTKHKILPNSVVSWVSNLYNIRINQVKKEFNISPKEEESTL